MNFNMDINVRFLLPIWKDFLPLYMEGQRMYSVFAFAIMCKLQKSGESKE